jgi:hypothetical protein
MKTASSIEVQGVQVILRAQPQFIHATLKLPFPFSSIPQYRRFSVEDAERIAGEILAIAATARQLTEPAT